MYAMSILTGKTNAIASRRAWLLRLTGFTVMYQIVYRALTPQVLQEEASSGECSLDSPLCAEAELFRSWHDTVLEPHLADLHWRSAIPADDEGAMLRFSTSQEPSLSSVVSPTTTPGPAFSPGVGAAIVFKPPENKSGYTSGLRGSGKKPLAASVMGELHQHTAKLERGRLAASEGHAAWQSDFDEKIHLARLELCGQGQRRELPECVRLLAQDARWQHSREEKDELRRQTAELDNGLKAMQDRHSEWQRDFDEKANAIKLEFCNDPHRREHPHCAKLLASAARKKHHVEEEAELERRMGEFQAAFKAADARHAEWEHNFEEKAHQALVEMCEQPHRRARPDCVELLAAEQQRTNSSKPKSSGKKSVGASILEGLRQQSAELEKGLLAVSEGHAAWQRSFNDEVLVADLELCKDPHRRDLPECVQLLASANVSDPVMGGNADLKRHADELRAAFKVVDDHHASWERSFVERGHQEHLALCEDPSRRDRPHCVKLLAAAAKDAHASASQHGPSELENHKQQLDAAFAAVDSSRAAFDREFEKTAQQMRQELCSAPHRRHRPDCAEFFPVVAEAEQSGEQQLPVAGFWDGLRQLWADESDAVSAVKQEAQAALNQEFESKVRQIHLDMCNDPRRRDRKDCIRLLAEQKTSKKVADSAASQQAASNLRQGRRQLRWSPVVAWSAGGWFSSTVTGRVRLESDDLEAVRWAENMPKVACVTALPSGGVTRDGLWSFINHFYHQDYDGQSQLVLVYDHRDMGTAELVLSYADGKHIIAVGARGNSSLPSTTALRFGAWSVGADVQAIAQWDYNMKQHPMRLSMQIRALAFSSRPVCALNQSKGTTDEVDAASLTGEVKWMR